MSVESLAEVLVSHPFLRDLKLRHVEVIASLAKWLDLAPGQYLWRQGQRLESIYLILSGEVALEIFIPNQGALEIDTVRAGELLPWFWLEGAHRRHFDARALTAVGAFILDGNRLRALCEQDHEMGYELLKRFARATEERLQGTRLKLLELHGFKMG